MCFESFTLKTATFSAGLMICLTGSAMAQTDCVALPNDPACASGKEKLDAPARHAFGTRASSISGKPISGGDLGSGRISSGDLGSGRVKK